MSKGPGLSVILQGKKPTSVEASLLKGQLPLSLKPDNIWGG